MKTIPIRTFGERDQKGAPVTSLTLLRMALDAPSREGLTMEDIRKRMRIHDAIEAVNEPAVALSLEDADFAVLMGVWRATPWATPNRALVAVDDDLNAAERGK